ncbi:MAG TPA: Hsp20/alpha crystallin family protein [Solirubrobacterales bacterium]|jgi:HSP20 family protein|nr:Hsp20/alpha crystallin family protein [Solirubrobacterales bacterium]
MATELTEWRPFSEFADLRHRLDQVFRDFGDAAQHGWTPSVDVVRKDDELVLRANLPGIKAEEVKIQVEDDVLTISGEHREEKEEKKDDYVRRERRFGSFSRSMALPAGTKVEDIEATTEDGVLEVTVPLSKSEERKAVEIKPKSKSD